MAVRLEMDLGLLKENLILIPQLLVTLVIHGKVGAFGPKYTHALMLAYVYIRMFSCAYIHVFACMFKHMIYIYNIFMIAFVRCYFQ